MAAGEEEEPAVRAGHTNTNSGWTTFEDTVSPGSGHMTICISKRFESVIDENKNAFPVNQGLCSGAPREK